MVHFVLCVCVVVGHVVSWGRLPRVRDPEIARVLCAPTCDECVSLCVTSHCDILYIPLCAFCALCIMLVPRRHLYFSKNYGQQKQIGKLCEMGRGKFDFRFMLIL